MSRNSHVKLCGRNIRSLSVGGQSLVEFAMVVPLLMLLVFGVIDFGRLFFTQMTLQHAMREAGRFGVTGNKLPDPNNPAQQLSRINSIRQVVQQAAVGLAADISQIQVTSGSNTNSAGGPGETLTVALTYDLRLITPIIGQFFNNGIYRFMVSTTFKNEPFPPSQTN